MMFFGSLSNVNSLECVSMKNQECKVRSKILDVSSSNPIFYPFSVEVNKCSGNCNNINDRYARICVPDDVKNSKVKEFNLITLTNEARHIKWHETCKCLYRLDGIICNNKQRWNEDKCKCECKELIDKSVWDKGFIQNPSNCECECDKGCDIGGYLDYSNCKCKKKLVDPLVEECTENIDELNLVKKTLGNNENKDKCNSYVVFKVLFSIFFLLFIISIVIGIYFVYRNYVDHNKYGLPYQTNL